MSVINTLLNEYQCFLNNTGGCEGEASGLNFDALTHPGISFNLFVSDNPSIPTYPGTGNCTGEGNNCALQEGDYLFGRVNGVTSGGLFDEGGNLLAVDSSTENQGFAQLSINDSMLDMGVRT